MNNSDLRKCETLVVDGRTGLDTVLCKKMSGKDEISVVLSDDSDFLHLKLQSWSTEFHSVAFWKAIFAEFVGTAILVFFGVGSTINFPGATPTVLSMCLAAGLAGGSCIWIFAHMSGAHLSPSITMAFLVARKMSVIRALLYWLVQCTASICSCYILKALTPPKNWGPLGATVLVNDVTQVQGVFMEFLITFIMVTCFFATTDDKRNDHHGSGPLTMALVVVVCRIFGINYTCASMNTAISLGPAVVMGIWTDFWIYVVGPLAGGMMAAMVYEHIIAGNSSWKKTKAYFTTLDYDASKFHNPNIQTAL